LRYAHIELIKPTHLNIVYANGWQDYKPIGFQFFVVVYDYGHKLSNNSYKCKRLHIIFSNTTHKFPLLNTYNHK